MKFLILSCGIVKIHAEGEHGIGRKEQEDRVKKNNLDEKSFLG